MTTGLDVFKAICDALTAGAALVAATVAIVGLKTWKSEFRARTQYDLARRVLRGVQRLRDEIAAVRQGWILPGEAAAAFEEAKIDPGGDPMRHPRMTALVYEQKWKPLAQAFSDLRPDMLEAEAHWGEPIRDADKALRAVRGRLSWAVSKHVQGQADRLPANLQEQMESIFYQTSEDPAEDAFTGQIEKAVGAFETILRPHITLEGGASSRGTIAIR